MSQYFSTSHVTFKAAVDIEAYRLVRLDSSGPKTANIGTSGSSIIGCSTAAPVSSGKFFTVRLFNDTGTVKLTAAGAIASGALVYAAGSEGKIDDAVNGRPVGIALEAATANNDIIEVLPLINISTDVKGVAADYAIARGRHTTVTAADTISTGLGLVVSAVGSMESDPQDDPFMCSVVVGDQSGAPPAGSIIVKTWRNTGGTDPTPLAATTFSRLVNWIAVGVL